ncbi:vacuole membrane protein 1 isoform X1 [Anopheles darlingi]|uniref:vacuole membrane protein 1 isoform X1 n=2 Tax=Anopheles darlingi TaxID=43151 RepID=UPI0021004EF9|nr:vacuole membrane protein 1 isoform X1 [Anopheles darlingi]XP_049533468.1 vacuole membrane protein 1 isoform X1 [Anopheles darlingi]XP_049533469.1 vacuole membrane protein 1 isoform X1 [Anopheles darlingi]
MPKKGSIAKKKPAERAKGAGKSDGNCTDSKMDCVDYIEKNCHDPALQTENKTGFNMKQPSVLAGNSHYNASSLPSSKIENRKLAREIKSLVLWKSPMKTMKYASLELLFLAKSNVERLLKHRAVVTMLFCAFIALLALLLTPGQHQQIIKLFKSNGFFMIYWLGLGILSSVGLGTGLHTFLLYLGPHIASVTLAAYECSSLNFPEPPYPNEILCPESTSSYGQINPSLWSIMAKVRLEAFLWGAGTALGELPPYFMAKAARLSGNTKEEHENIQELEKLQKRKKKGEKLTFFDKGKLFMEDIVERVGFFGILLCASIPNPLFDLAGITCGHFLVPFWKFFGATLIGKAIIKMHIQKIFVIISFNENLVEKFIKFLAFIPIIGVRLQVPFKVFFENQKQRLHRNTQKTAVSNNGNLLSTVFESFVFIMVCYFIVSIVNTLAQNCCKRTRKQPHHGSDTETQKST